jgi:hypothetical protein
MPQNKYLILVVVLGICLVSSFFIIAGGRVELNESGAWGLTWTSPWNFSGTQTSQRTAPQEVETIAGISITSPAANAKLSGTVTIGAEISGYYPEDIKSSQFMVDGVSVGYAVANDQSASLANIFAGSKDSILVDILSYLGGFMGSINTTEARIGPSLPPEDVLLPLECARKDNNPVYVGNQVSFIASGGDGISGNYVWFAQYGVPRDWTGDTFGVSFSTAGYKVVTLTNNSEQVICTLNVLTKPLPPTIYKQVSWDTTRASNGNHTLRAVLTLNNGSVLNSQDVTVTVDNGSISVGGYLYPVITSPSNREEVNAAGFPVKVTVFSNKFIDSIYDTIDDLERRKPLNYANLVSLLRDLLNGEVSVVVGFVGPADPLDFFPCGFADTTELKSLLPFWSIEVGCNLSMLVDGATMQPAASAELSAALKLNGIVGDISNILSDLRLPVPSVLRGLLEKAIVYGELVYSDQVEVLLSHNVRSVRVTKPQTNSVIHGQQEIAVQVEAKSTQAIPLIQVSFNGETESGDDVSARIAYLSSNVFVKVGESGIFNVYETKVIWDTSSVNVPGGYVEGKLSAVVGGPLSHDIDVSLVVPNVQFADPTQNETVTGITAVEVYLVSYDDPDYVQINIDSGDNEVARIPRSSLRVLSILRENPTIASYTGSGIWDTRNVSNGSHKLTANLTTRGSTKADSEERSVTVNNPVRRINTCQDNKPCAYDVPTGCLTSTSCVGVFAPTNDPTGRCGRLECGVSAGTDCCIVSQFSSTICGSSLNTLLLNEALRCLDTR